MSKTYDNAPDEVIEQINDLLELYHPKLKEAGVTIHALMAHSTGGDAVSVGGYPALACVRIISLKDRVKGMKDVEIVIDAERFDELTEPQRLALLDHELHHLETVPDEGGGCKRDDASRPKLVMRRHDVQFGWFKTIAERHGSNSPEQIQAKTLIDKHGQSFFPFLEAAA